MLKIETDTIVGYNDKNKPTLMSILGGDNYIPPCQRVLYKPQEAGNIAGSQASVYCQGISGSDDAGYYGKGRHIERGALRLF